MTRNEAETAKYSCPRCGWLGDKLAMDDGWIGCPVCSKPKSEMESKEEVMKLLHVVPVNEPDIIAIQWDGGEITNEIKAVCGDQLITKVGNHLILQYEPNSYTSFYVLRWDFIVRENGVARSMTPKKFHSKYKKRKV